MYFKLCGAVPYNYVAFKSKNYFYNIIASLFLVQSNKHLELCYTFPTKYWFENVDIIQCRHSIRYQPSPSSELYI